MPTYNTGNSVPSNDIRDTSDNAEVFDSLVNSTGTVTDRLGNTRDTVDKKIDDRANIAIQRYSAFIPKGDWATGIGYKINDLWKHTGTGDLYLVIEDYTSGADEDSDIASGSVVIFQPQLLQWQAYSIADMKTMTPTNEGQLISLSDGGRSGVFEWLVGDYSANVTADTQEGLYVAVDSDPTGSSGVLRRVYERCLTLKHFGAIGDGISNDSPAIQGALNILPLEENLTIYANSGDYRMVSEATINIGDYISLSIIGEGSSSTRFIIDNSTGGIGVISSQRTSTVELRDLAFVVDGVDTGYGFKFTIPEGGNQAERRSVIENVFIGREDMFTTGSIDYPLEVSGAYRPYISNVVINCSPLVDNTGVGLSIDGTYKAHIQNSYVNGSYAIGVSDEGESGEGGYCVGTTVNGSYVGYKRTRINLEPEFWVDKSHFNCLEKGVWVENCKYVWLTNNLMYTSAADGANYKDFYITKGYQFTIQGNTYRQPYDTTRTHIYLDTADSLEGVIVKDERLSATAQYYIFANSLVTHLEIFESPFISTESFVSYPSGYDKYDIRTIDVIIHTGFDMYTYANNDASHPDINIYRHSESPAAGDALDQTTQYGRNSSGDWVAYASNKTEIGSEVSGSEYGNRVYFSMENGVLARQVTMGSGFSVGGSGTPTKGAGTINAGTGYYANNKQGSSGTFTTTDGKTITITGGIVTSIV